MVHLQPAVDPDIQTTVADVIKAIIAISANSNDQGVIGPNALSRSLVSGPVVSKLVSNMIRNTESGSNASLTTGVSIIIELIRKNNSDYDLTPILALAFNNQPPSSRDPIYLGTMLRIFANAIADFQALLLSPKNVRMIKTSGYGEIESLGFERFRICELYAELLHCSNMGLLNDPRGEAVVKDRDEERERLRLIAKKNDLASDTKSLAPTRTESESDTGTISSPFRRESSVGSQTLAVDPSEEVSEAFATEKDRPRTPTDASVALEHRRRSSSEEWRHRPEERRGSRGSFDEESRPYMPNVQIHGVDHHPDTQEDEMKIMADIGPQTHPVLKPETAKADVASYANDIAVSSRTPTPPHDTTNLSPSIPHDISNATSDSILPSSTEPDLNIDLDHIVRSQHSIPSSEEDLSAHRGPVPHSDLSDTVSISSTISSRDNSSETFEPVIGDYLKMQFMNQHVISTILELFFKFPWNNFLHNVVYDVVQQVFNGPMDRGYNRVLAIDVFAQGNLCERIVAGQKASDEHTTGDGVRLGYMGHLTLIAEEVVKFVERYPPQSISPLITEKVTAPEWIEYVETTLAATRARDSAVLGGERPRIPQQQQQASSGMTWEMNERSYDMEDDDEELQRQMGQFAISEDGDVSADQFAKYITQQISNEAPISSDEDEDDEEMSEWMHERGDFLERPILGISPPQGQALSPALERTTLDDDEK